MPAYRILCCDGGGIRGLFTARLLERIEGEVPGFLQQFELFAGTSTGGIIALGLAAGMRPADLVALYRTKGPQIFDESWLDGLRDLGGLSGAKYDNVQLKKVLAAAYGPTGARTLADLKKRVLVPSFDLDDGQDPRRKPGKLRSWKPKFFHNYPGPDSDGAELVVDVAMRTSAAPTYFPSYGRFVDGGVFANDPSMAALAQALCDTAGNQQLRDVRLLSVGTGINPTYIDGHDHDWGYAQWVRPIIGLMMDGVMGVAAFQCGQLLGSRYYRLNCVFDQSIPLDGYQKVDALLAYADRLDISEAVDWVRDYAAPQTATTAPPAPGRRRRRTQGSPW